MIDTAIIDIDGVCFDPEARLAHARNKDGQIQWDVGFSNKVIFEYDKPIHNAATLIHSIAVRFQIVYITDRLATCYEATVQMLIEYGFPLGMVCMRTSNFESDKHVWITRLGDSCNFVFAFDDDYGGKLESMYTEFGIPMFKSQKEINRFLGLL